MKQLNIVFLFVLFSNETCDLCEGPFPSERKWPQRSLEPSPGCWDNLIALPTHIHASGPPVSFAIQLAFLDLGNNIFSWKGPSDTSYIMITFPQFDPESMLSIPGFFHKPRAGAGSRSVVEIYFNSPAVRQHCVTRLLQTTPKCAIYSLLAGSWLSCPAVSLSLDRIVIISYWYEVILFLYHVTPGHIIITLTFLYIIITKATRPGIRNEYIPFASAPETNCMLAW